MLTASKTYRQQIEKIPFRNHSYMIVSIGVINQLAQAHADITSQTSYLSNNVRLFESELPQFRYATYEQNWWRADGKMLFAHCTLPLGMTEKHEYTTHFESGIGVAIHGELPIGAARIYKISADLQSCIDEEVELYANSYEDNLCRTQVLVSPSGHSAKELKRYFLRSPLGNHHILVI